MAASGKTSSAYFGNTPDGTDPHAIDIGWDWVMYGLRETYPGAVDRQILGNVFRSLENEHPEFKPAELEFIWTQITGMLRDQGRLAK